MPDKSVTIEMTAKTSGIITNTDLAADSVKNLATSTAQSGVTISSSMEAAQSSFTKSSKKLGEEADTLKSKLEKLREEGGRRSGIGEFSELLKGAGAVAGVSILGEVLKNATAKAVELDSAFREGKVDAMGLAVGIGESIPLIGGFVEAGQNIHEMIWHEKADLAAVNEEIKIGNEILKERRKIAEDNAKATHGQAEAMEKAQDTLAIDSATNPHDKKIAEEKAAWHERGRATEDSINEYAAKRRSEIEKLVKLEADEQDKETPGRSDDAKKAAEAESTRKESLKAEADINAYRNRAIAAEKIGEQGATTKAVNEDISAKIKAALGGAHEGLKGIVDSIAPGMKKITAEQEESWKKQKESQDEAAKKLREESKKMLDEANTPLEKFEEKIAKVTELLKGGTITKSQADKLDNKALADFDKETGGGGGFAKAPAPINENRRGALNLDPAAINPLVQVAKQQLEIDKQQADDIRLIRTQAQNSGTPVPYTGF